MIKTAKKLLSKLREENIKLVLKDNNLEIVSYQDRISSDLILEVKNQKQSLIDYLQSKNDNAFLSIPVVEGNKHYPLSSAQKRLWISSQFGDNSISYNMPSIKQLEGTYDIAYFIKAIDSVIERHEILRTVFRKDDQGEIRQWILDTDELNFVVDYKDFRFENNKDELVEAYVAQDAKEQFDLEHGPLIRASLFRVSEEQYLFYYNMHHIISDGWSMDIIAKDVLAYYTTYKNGIECSLPELRIQYKDYAAWQLAQLETKESGLHRSYWLDCLSGGELPLLDLPSQKYRPKIKSYKGCNLSTYISPEATNKLKMYSQNQGGSLFIGLLATWNILFHRYTSQKDIIIGTPVAGRNHIDLDDQIGFYVNTLALRNQLNPEESFESFFRRIKTSTLEAYDHQMYPFDSLLDDLELSRDMSRNPVFDVMLALQNTGNKAGSEQIDDSAIDSVSIEESVIAKFDMSITFKEIGDYLTFNINYNTDVYECDMVEGLMKHYKQLLNNLLDFPYQNIGEIDLLTELEKQELLCTFNNTKTAYSEQNTIVDLFSKQVQQTPNNTAIVFEDKKVTYKELDELSNQIANYLFDQGVKKGDLVPVYLDRSIEFIAAVFGILKSGGAYLPIDISYPRARIKFMLEDSGAKHILTSTALFSFQEFKNINPLYIDQINHCKSTIEPKKTKLNSDQLAYVIYTSGSTGKPKGVMIAHNSLVNYIDSQTKYFDFDSSEKVLQFSNFSFDASVEQIFLTLLNGASLFLVSRDQLLNPSLLPEVFKKYEITHFHSTPSYIEQLGSLENCTSLRRIVAGGDRCSIELAKNTPVFCDFYNKYGLTEATISSTIHKYRPTLDERKVLSIGSPMKNAQVYVLSEMLKLQPIGVVGEICISGVGLAKGYLHREELTNEKFISHPFLLDERLYKTGDLGCWLPDGSIEFVGRIDDQVKIRGHRIELGEIEYHLKSKSEINDAIVISRETLDNKDLVAYLVSDAALDTTSLRDYLSKKLPDYMLPNHYIQLSAIPLTINGKVDKNSLPDPVDSSLSTGVCYIAPRNVKESVLIDVWSDVLNRGSIGIKDNFYNLGGDSIKSIQVVSRLKHNGYCLKVEQILHYPVLEDLAKLMNENTRKIDQSTVTGAVDLTPIQHYFFNNPFIVVPNHYNQSVLLKASFNIDQGILDRSISILVAHHDVLRMAYKKEEDNWSQFNTEISDTSYKICFYDLRSEESPLDTMAELGEELQAGLNLESGPLFTVGHFRLEDGDRLALIAHHLIIDGVSWRILLEDLSTLYEGNRLNIDVNLPLKTDSFQTWASLQKEHVLSDKMDAERSYWEDICSNSVSSIPTKSEVTVDHIKYNGLETIFLDKKTTELLQTQVHSVYNTEINDILLTALGLAIRNVFGLEKTVLEMEGHGREDIIDEVDISRTIGWFTTIYPFVLDLSNSSNPTSALIEVKEALRKLPNKGIGFGMLKYLTEGFKEDIEPSIVFNYLGDFGSKVGNSEETLFEYSSEDIGASSSLKNGQARFLSISGMIVSEQLSMSIRYCKSLLDTEVMQLLASSYEDCLTVLIENLAVENKNYLTPSDITFKGLTKEELWAINYDYNVEDVYKLSPLQQGIYYHWLSDSSSPMYFEQMSYRLRAKQLDIAIVKEAYDQLVLRHPVLRTSFINDYGRESLQIVRKAVPSNFSYEKSIDIVKGGDIEEYVNTVKLDDRSRGFDLEEPSQMRLKVLDLGSGAYEFIWSHHHILMDGWCIGILINDFYQMLNAASQNKILNLPASPNYSNYIEWLDKVDKENSLQYWKEYLKAYDTAVGIPFKNIEVAEKSYQASHEVLKIEGDTFSKVNEFCGNLGITQNTFLQGIWGYLLSKYNSTKDVVFGSVVSGRPGELIGVEDMIGLFINTIPVRIKYNTNDTPVTLLKAIHHNSIDSNPHHYLNLSEVQSQSDLGMDLIDHILVFENFPVQEGIKEDFESNQENKALDLAIELIEVTERTNYDFDIAIGASDSSLSIKFNYNNSVYASESINTLANHFSRLIDGFIANPNQKLNKLTYVTESEEENILKIFNDTTVAYPMDKTFLDIFEENVEKYPDNLAVICGDNSFTYKEVDVLSNKLAFYLQDTFDIEKEDIIGVQLQRDSWLLISGLAVFKTGGVYLPIDPSYPDERISFLLDNSNCACVLDKDCLSSFLSQEDAIISDYTKVSLTGSDLAYVIYTSGSTGQPKGVMIEHMGMLNHMYAMKDVLDLNDTSVIVQNAPSTFDISIWQLFNCLIVGGTTSIYDQSTVLDPEQFLIRLQSDNVTILQVVPTYLKTLLELEDNLKSQYLGSISYLLVTGEAVTNGLINNWFTQYPEIKVVNAYGPAEASDDVTLHVMDRCPSRSIIPVGKPVQNMEVFILDSDLQLCGYDIVGEICASGIGVARGYLNQEELTAKKFVNNPFRKGKRLYKTGDLGRWLSDGTIEFVGRTDEQVKIRGHRIEIGELEYQLKLKENISQVVVSAKESKAGTKELVAYIVSDEKQHPANLRSYLSKSVPNYMLPSYFIQLEELPLTVNGKVNKKLLPDPNELGLSNTVDYVVPKTVEEKVLISVLEEVLNKNSISIKDSFYNLGGDSIKSIQVVSRLKQDGFSLKVNHILNTQVLEDLAKCITSGVKDIDQSFVEGLVELTPIQKYFFHDSNIKVPNHYNQSVVLKTMEKIDHNILERCLVSLVEHHDALRMIYKKENSQWSQYNQKPLGDHYVIDFYDLTNTENEQEEMYTIGSDLQSSINLEEGPLLKIVHFRLSDGDRLAIIIHHLVIDGVSWRILLEDLANLYSSYNQGGTANLPLKTDSFQFWASQLKLHSNSVEVLQEKPYWESVCKESISSILKDIKYEDGFAQFDSSLSFTLQSNTTELLQTVIPELYNVKINDVLLTTLGLAVKEVFGSEKIGISMEGHGREEILEDVDVSRTLGWFTSIYPFVLNVSSPDNITNLILNKQKFGEIPNKGIGYGILKYLKGDCNLDCKPEIEFNYLGDFGNKVGKEESIFEFSSESIGSSNNINNGSDSLLGVSGMISFDQLKISVLFSKLIFNTNTINKLLKAYQNKLDELINELSSDKPHIKEQFIKEEAKYNTSNLSNEINWESGSELEISRNQQHYLRSKYAQAVKSFEISSFNEDKFEENFREFLSTLPSLCIDFERDGDKIVQRYVSSKKLKLKIEIKQLDPKEEKENHDYIISYFDRPFDVYKGELIRVLVISNSVKNKSAKVFISLHHSIADDYTARVIREKLISFFENNARTNDYLSNCSFINWQKEFLTSKKGFAQREYWMRLLKPSILNNERIENEKGVSNFVTQKITISNTDFDNLQGIAKASNLSVNSIFLAAYQKLLRDVKPKGKSLHSILVNSREQKINGLDMSKVLGVMDNILPIPYDASEDNFDTIFINNVFSKYLEARINQQVPYEMIREDCKQKCGKDLEASLAGEFNFLLKKETNLDENVNEIVTFSEKFIGFRGINLTCEYYPNAIRLSLIALKEIYQEKEDVLSLNLYIKDIMSLLNHSK